MPVPLPPPRRRAGRYRVAVVCLGNICRSPMADVVLSDRVEGAGLANAVEVVSSGTGGWHVGSPMDRRAAALLTAHGYDATRHRAQRFEADWFDECDLILAMDRDNHADITAQAPDAQAPDEPDPDARVRMFRDFDPRPDDRGRDGDRDVPDPYYGGDDGFETVLAIVERTADALVAALAATVTGGGVPQGVD